MPTPTGPDTRPGHGTGVPTDPDPAPDVVPDVAVNIARPVWQCPHCKKKYGEDHAAATACAQAGPAPAATTGTPLLALERSLGHSNRTLFGATVAGPVTAVTLEGRRVHRHPVTLDGHDVTAALETAAPARDGLRIVAGGPAAGKSVSADLYSHAGGTFDAVGRLFFAGWSPYGSYDPSPVPVWFEDHRYQQRDEKLWWRAPDPAERAALNVVTDGLLDRVLDTDLEQLAADIRRRYQPNYRHRHGDMRPEDLVTTDSALALADAHGAPNHVWTLRWLAAHLEEITRWQAAMVHAWAAGISESATEAVPLLASVYLKPNESLPRNPGKRRLAVMEPFGDDYRDVVRVITGRMATPPPVSPVPGVPDVTATIHARAARGTATCEGN